MVKSSRYRGVTLFRPTGKWRAQISSGGKTTSLGDHDTEEEAARAFDRAAINKAGRGAQINFDISDYEPEIDALQKMSQQDLVSTLRSKARRHSSQTSRFRGVSLLKQTGKWHAQINFGGKQLHLGFFAVEEAAARAYDRAAIYKAAAEKGPITTNFDLSEYTEEMERLQSMTQQELLALLAEQKAAVAAVSGGLKRERSPSANTPPHAPKRSRLAGGGSDSSSDSDPSEGDAGPARARAGLAQAAAQAGAREEGQPAAPPRGKARRTRQQPQRAPY